MKRNARRHSKLRREGARLAQSASEVNARKEKLQGAGDGLLEASIATYVYGAGGIVTWDYASRYT